MQSKRIVIGNWKMNGSRGEFIDLCSHLVDLHLDAVDIRIALPATMIEFASTRGVKHGLAIGAQDCHREDRGAFTGDVSAHHLVEAGAVFVILGHSERRSFHREDNQMIALKAAAAWRMGLVSVICVGESLEEYLAGQSIDFVTRQIMESVPADATSDNTVIAYEPIWAIGTGRIPDQSEIVSLHARIRQQLRFMLGAAGGPIPILYGGSVSPSNAAAILSIADVDGVLVGGSSLKASTFMPIVDAARHVASH